MCMRLKTLSAGRSVPGTVGNVSCIFFLEIYGPLYVGKGHGRSDNGESLSMLYFSRIDSDSTDTLLKRIARGSVSNSHFSTAPDVPRPLDNAQHHPVLLRETFLLLRLHNGCDF